MTDSSRMFTLTVTVDQSDDNKADAGELVLTELQGLFRDLLARGLQVSMSALTVRDDLEAEFLSGIGPFGDVDAAREGEPSGAVGIDQEAM